MSRPPRRPAPPRHTVAVEIAGEKHVLRSDVPPEYTRAVAAHVDATIRALPGFQTLEPFRAATLAALSITDELFRAREEIRRLREDSEYRTGILADQLEAAVAAAAEQRPVRRPAAAPASAAWTTDAAAASPPTPPAAPASATPPPLPASPAPPSPEPRPGPVDAPALVNAPPVAETELRPPPLSGTVPAWQEDAAASTPSDHERPDDGDPELEFPPPE
ncbi:MAG TPA: cell division protein ZapA [Longimicrobium sp.]|nr:cell division protein ZapA [Longimicrobium sp.]